ncbi:MAG TPA: patatin-like phospholipase family protein, partial [Burkholderiaceae bacterium]
MPSSRPTPRPPADEECILVLQGGGALGAYQAGVLEALSTENHEPTWVAGISIGAINAALIAGNAPARRVERLREFWDTMSSALPALPVSAPLHAREGLNQASASQVMLFGVPGFFTPRFPPAPFQPRGT